MKRSTYLSASLVGCSLIMASAAYAAPSTKDQPIKVAQAEPTSPSSSPSDSPTAVPSDGSSTIQPAVTIGTATAPAADAPSASAPETEKKPKPRPFAGSSLFIQNSVTTGTIFKGQQQDYNPTVEGSLWFLPRYAINEAFQLRGRLTVSYEYTNSDSTTYGHEPMLSDTSLQLFYRKIPQFLGFQPAVALGAGLPTSKASRARTLLFSPGLSAQLSRSFEHVLGGDMAALVRVGYSHPIYSSKNPEVVDPRPAGAFQCIGGNACSDLLSGTMNPSDAVTYSLLVEGEWGHFNPAIMYLGTSQWAYHPTDARNPVDGTVIGTPAGFDPVTVRQSHYLSAWLDYNFNAWLTGEVGYWSDVNAIGGSGQRANVIFDRYQDSRVYLGASIQLDNLVKALQGGSEGEAGVVRAKNEKIPMWTF